MSEEIRKALIPFSTMKEFEGMSSYVEMKLNDYISQNYVRKDKLMSTMNEFKCDCGCNGLAVSGVKFD